MLGELAWWCSFLGYLLHTQLPAEQATATVVLLCIEPWLCVWCVYRREGAIVVGQLALCLEREEVPHKSGLGVALQCWNNTHNSHNLPPTQTHVCC